ncbi:MAG: hypothetical protein CMH96_00615 [Oceanospirillaceae bacterium]|nr:hypothetical protein [Oceanospirillaceae bacterium]
MTVGKEKALKLSDADGSNYMALQAPTEVNSNLTLMLPNSQGSAGQFLQLESIEGENSNLSWQTMNLNDIPYIQFNGQQFENSLIIGLDNSDKLSNANKNVGIGVEVFSALEDGDNNIALGFKSLEELVSGYGNVSIGNQALEDNNAGSRNTAVGNLSLNNAKGKDNTAVGHKALEYINGSSNNNYNIAIGSESGFNVHNSTGSIYIGSQSKGFSSLNEDNRNIYRSNEIVIGHQAEGRGSNSITIGNKYNKNTYLRGQVTIDKATNSENNNSLIVEGNVGIGGNTNPNTALNVNGMITASGKPGVEATDGVTALTVHYNGGNDRVANFGSMYSTGAPFIAKGVESGDLGKYYSTVDLENDTEFARGILEVNDSLIFKNAAEAKVPKGQEVTMTERMKIDADGNLSVAGDIEATGDLTLGNAKGLNFRSTDGQKVLTLKAPNDTNNLTLTLPRNDGDAGQVLGTDGSGQLSWVSINASEDTSERDTAIVPDPDGSETGIVSGPDGPLTGTPSENNPLDVITTGKIGIGTSSPSEALTIKTQSDPYFPGIKVEDYQSSVGLYMQSVAAHNFGIGTGRYYNSGIWRTDISAPSSIRFTMGSGNGGKILFYAQDGVSADGNGKREYTPIQRMVIGSDGKVGIGRDNDHGSAMLDVKDAIAVDGKQFVALDQSKNKNRILLGDVAAQDSDGIQDLALRTADTDRLIIESNGNVTIKNDLHVEEDIRIGSESLTALLQNNNNADKSSGIKPTYSFFNDDTTGIYRPKNSTYTLAFVTQGTEKMRINELGHLRIGSDISMIATDQLYIGANGLEQDVTIGLGPTNHLSSRNPYSQIGASSDEKFGSNLYFKTRSKSSTIEERMRIGSDGKVTIFADLEVQGKVISDGVGKIINTSDIATGAVTSDQIQNGSIVDRDISSKTKINGTKINPDFGDQNVLTTAHVGIGTSTPKAKLDVAGTIRIYPDNGSAILRFGSGGEERGVIALDSSKNMVLETGKVERMRIGSDGIVTIKGDLQVEGKINRVPSKATIGEETVESINIKDGTITNADINVSAAIAGTKINPDFGTQTISTTGSYEGRNITAIGTGSIGSGISIENKSKVGDTVARTWSIFNMHNNGSRHAYRNNLEFWAYSHDGSDRCSEHRNGLCEPRVVFTDSGNVGIGTKLPKARLHVGGGNVNDLPFQDITSEIHQLSLETPFHNVTSGSRQPAAWEFWTRDNGIDAHLDIKYRTRPAFLTARHDGKVSIGQSSFGANGNLQVTGGIGLSGNSEIRQSTDSDGSILRFLGTQFIAGHLNSTSYSYDGSGLIASISPMASEVMLDVGAMDAEGHRLKVINGSSGKQGSLEYKSEGNVIFKADSSSGELLIGNNIAFGKENATGIRRGNLGELILGAKSGGLFHQVKDEKDAQGKIEKKYYKINTVAGYTSDARLKENIVPIDSALDKVMQMEGVYYNFIEEQKSASLNGQQIGVIAQNIEAVFPEAVVEQDNIKHVRYDILIAPLIEAIKELKLQNEALSARVQQLEESKP